MKLASSLAVVVLLTLFAWAEAADQVAKSVVKIYVTHREPDFLRPWNKGNAQETPARA